MFPNKKYILMKAPVLSRWYLVGLGYTHLFENWDKWLQIAQFIINANSATSAPKKCASTLTSLIAEPALKAHAAYVSDYHKCYWNKHYVWLTAKDELTSKSGFRSHQMGVRFFVILNDLKRLKDG